MNNKRGSVLVVSFLVILVLATLGGIMLSRSISERTLTQRYAESTQAFWMAEGGVSRALKELGDDFIASGSNAWQAAFTSGRYSVDVESVDTETRKVISHGYVPAQGAARIERIIEVLARKNIPADFYDYAIYSAGEADLNGNAFSVGNNEPPPDNKAILYGATIDTSHPENISGITTYDASASPLALLDFQQLRSLSAAQGNVYDAARLNNIKKGQDSFPPSFWYSSGVPNIVYVEGDLVLNGNIGTIGGFFVVAGDVLTNPDAEYDATINGNGMVEGAIYTRGEFEVNGGGGNLNINGGVWAGQEAELNGNAAVTFNREYMSAIEALGINAGVQVSSWKDSQNPYTLSP